MQKNKNILYKGFTLLEVLLVIGATAVLATVTIVAINPARQMAQIRDNERKIEMEQIYSALRQYYSDNRAYPSAVESMPEWTLQEICAQNASDCTGKLDLDADLSPLYLSYIPSDPLAISPSTGYFLFKRSDGRLLAYTDQSELVSDIIVNGNSSDMVYVPPPVPVGFATWSTNFATPELLSSTWTATQDAINDLIPLYNQGESTAVAGSLGFAINKWAGGVLAPNGMIYGIPHNSSAILKIDPTDNSSMTFGSVGTGNAKWSGGVLAPNGIIYAIPASASDVLKIDPTTDNTSFMGENLGSANYKWAGGVLAPNGKIYAIPEGAGSVLKIDPVADTVETFGLVFNSYRSTVLAPNGKIYGIPYSSPNVVVVDPTDDSITSFGSLGSDMNKWSGGVLAPNGMIYGMPCDATSVLRINPNNNTVETFGNLGSDTSKWIGGALGADGKIYGAPASASSILRINPNSNPTNDTVETFGSVGGGGYKWVDGVLAPNGRIYFIPFVTNVFRYVLAEQQIDDIDFPLSRFFVSF